jgi:uncharacterized SAM-binding protein YcdF (DUF218 family)
MDYNDITAYVDIYAPPVEPTAHVIFGTNQRSPVDMAASRYHQGLAPLIIATGGVNRHNGIIEGQEFHRALLDRDVPATAIRYEDRSVNTWQNVEHALPFLNEALTAGLSITAISKWYHLRAIYALRKFLPDVDVFYALSFDPIYDGAAVTRSNWPQHPSGKRRVIREEQEVSQRIADGDLQPATRNNGWRPRMTRPAS